MARSDTPRTAAKRAAILDAAQACFLESGYAGTSMDQMAARAGVSKATIYAHFQGKDELFGAIICRRCDDEADGLGAVAATPGQDARAALTAAGRQLLDMFLSPEVLRIYRVVVAESARHPDLADAFYRAGPVRGRQRVADLLAGLAARGELRLDDPWQATDAFIGMLRSECFQRALFGLPPNPAATPDSTVAAAVDIMLRAFGR
ncbi:TetR/AcrR family transcriptional regulator [Magnetospirillum sp. UT-4]|uniref:TetR/AcrR family transcriptional regulator n=1 Tax=Magnetospirillum sp. UT-4 TaxID=2681467 RepID=UPI001380B1ED|nr:TetR/AcrR family transcriptional regulator [Magnetospirillum sp. UT-4]CAA7619204.1 Regulatory protein, TetR [Magnetospirillum sp. UT-4]